MVKTTAFAMLSALALTNAAEYTVREPSVVVVVGVFLCRLCDTRRYCVKPIPGIQELPRSLRSVSYIAAVCPRARPDDYATRLRV